ncbi:MAG: hypothetical protein ACR2NR_07455 [Solirubrobacteraceae bacterium]
MDDDTIRALVQGLARRNTAGGAVIERAAILAAGDESEAILAWITSHEGQAETVAPKTRGRGLHGGQVGDGASTQARAPARYVLPPGVLS